jgi:hypothetical protein
MMTDKMKTQFVARLTRLVFLGALALPTAAQEKSFEEMVGDVHNAVKEMPKPRLAGGLETAAWVSLGNVARIWDDNVSVLGHRLASPQDPGNAPFGDKGVDLRFQPYDSRLESEFRIQAKEEGKLKERRTGTSWEAFEGFRILSWIDEKYHEAPVRLQEYLDALKKIGEGPWTPRINEEIEKVNGLLKKAQEDLKGSGHQRYHELRLKTGKELGILDENGNPLSATQRISRDLEKLQEKTRRVLEERERR